MAKNRMFLVSVELNPSWVSEIEISSFFKVTLKNLSAEEQLKRKKRALEGCVQNGVDAFLHARRNRDGMLLASSGVPIFKGTKVQSGPYDARGILSELVSMGAILTWVDIEKQEKAVMSRLRLFYRIPMDANEKKFLEKNKPDIDGQFIFGGNTSRVIDSIFQNFFTFCNPWQNKNASTDFCISLAGFLGKDIKKILGKRMVKVSFNKKKRIVEGEVTVIPGR